jgi:hypothetical protein
MVISPERLMTGDRTEMRLHSQPDRVISPKGLMTEDRTGMRLLGQIGRVINPKRLMTGIRTGMRLPGQTGLFLKLYYSFVLFKHITTLHALAWETKACKQGLHFCTCFLLRKLSTGGSYHRKRSFFSKLK